MEFPDVIKAIQTTDRGGFWEHEYINRTSYKEADYHHSRIKEQDDATIESLRRENEELKAKYQETDTLYWQQVSEIAELKAKLDKAKDALRSIASFGEGEFVTSSFDEPHAARRARTTLEEIK